MFVLNLILCSFAIVNAGPNAESYKGQFCTDPRTMKKHEAYTEWADAYSCTRHRCQPGGRNLAIYTVGCKRVEAPESAIECEEVVEDTNMQFPYCCTRLRCLVVVRGEVWTRVLGQPWETLPAAPWSHMYKMKKPPPPDGTFLAKNAGEGPVYELAEAPVENNGGKDKVLRSGKKAVSANADCNDTPALRAAPPQTPDIVIALSTSNDVKNDHKKSETGRYTHLRKTGTGGSTYIDDEANEQHNEDIEETPQATEKPVEQSSDEKFYAHAFGVTQKITMKAVANNQGHSPVSWTEIPQNQWNEHDQADQESMTHQEPPTLHQQDPASHEVEKRDEKPNNLQALVDAIGNRMRDIEHVVQRMSEKVHQAKPGDPENGSSEKRTQPESDSASKHHKESRGSGKDVSGKPKKQSPEGDHYKSRFSVHNRGSKYLHAKTDSTTDQPLFVEDTNMNGYFSDASNSVLRRSGTPKEPAILTYMAPIENRRKSAHLANSDSEEMEKKRKKHAHKKKKTKNGKSHKKHHAKEDKKKRHKGLNSVEVEKINVVSLEDSSALVSK